MDKTELPQATVFGIGMDCLPSRFTVVIENDILEGSQKGEGMVKLVELFSKIGFYSVSATDDPTTMTTRYRFVKRKVGGVLDYVEGMKVIGGVAGGGRYGGNIDGLPSSEHIGEKNKVEVPYVLPPIVGKLALAPTAKISSTNVCSKCYGIMPDGCIKCKSCGTVKRMGTSETGAR